MGRPALEQCYKDELRERLRGEGSGRNVHEVPFLEKIVINSAIGADSEKTWVDEVVKDISLIAGQRPVVIRARKSISNFKLRAGVPNGVKVTLRAQRMYEFLYRLVSIAIPRLRDFRGLAPRCDGRGNFTFGIADHTIFPEISVDRERKAIGMDITLATSAKSDEEAVELLRELGVPFVRRFGEGTKA